MTRNLSHEIQHLAEPTHVEFRVNLFASDRGTSNIQANNEVVLAFFHMLAIELVI